MDVLDKLWKARHPKDALFLRIIKGYEIKVIKEYPDKIFYMKNDKILMYYNTITKDVCINYNLIWSVFSSNFSLNYLETRELFRDILETYLKLEETNPYAGYLQQGNLLEKHLKLERPTHLSINISR